MPRAGQAAVLEDPGQPEQGERTVAGGLADDRVAGCQGCPHLVRIEFQRVVEGHDCRHHPDGLADREGHVALGARDGIHGHLTPEDPFGLLPEAAQDAARRVDLLAGLPDGLAVLFGKAAGETLALSDEAVGCPHQDRSACMGRQGRHAPPTLLGCLDGACHILLAGRRHMVDDGAIGRIHDGDRPSVTGVTPLAVDQHLHRSPLVVDITIDDCIMERCEHLTRHVKARSAGDGVPCR
ncbi:hypothetical protein BH23CHL8_BH23CHL8_22400 [soil metagenome]